MNRIFRTVWNRVRRQLVAVNESVTGASQASGSTVRGSVVNAQPVNTVGVTLKKSALALAVGSALALSLPAANASWIDDNGGVDGKLTWTVGTQGTTDWNVLTQQKITIDDGQTLTIKSAGSDYMPQDTTVPDMLSRSVIFNEGTLNINWQGSDKQSTAETEAIWLDNSGIVSVTMNNPTPTAGSWLSGPCIHGIEVQRGSFFDYEANGWTDEDEFINRAESTVKIDIDFGATNLSSEQAEEWMGYANALVLNGESISGRNEGTIDIDVTTANSHMRGIWLTDGATFENAESGLIEITLDQKGSDPQLVDFESESRAIGLNTGTSFTNNGTIDAVLEGFQVSAVSFQTNGTAQETFTNNGTFTFELTSTAEDTGINAHAIRLGTNDRFENYGTFKGTIYGTGTGIKGIELLNSSSVLTNEVGAIFDITLNATAVDEEGARAFAQGIYLDGGERFDNKGSETFTVNVDATNATDVSQFTQAIGVFGGEVDDSETNYGTLTNAKGAELNLNISGPVMRGIYARNYMQVQNEGAISIKLTRESDDLVYGGDAGVWLGYEASLTNNGTITISSDVATNGNFMMGASVANTMGTLSGISLSSGDLQTKQYLVNNADGVIDIDIKTENTKDGLTTGQRVYGASLASANVQNTGKMYLDATADYGVVDAGFDVFASMALSFGEANTYSTDVGFIPVFENSGLIEGSATTIAEGINVSSNKGWAIGFNLHGAVQFNNTGTIDLSAYSTSRSKAGSVEGSTFINDKDVTFEATTDAEGSFAYALNVGKPNAQVTQSRSYVDNNGTLNLIAESQSGYAYGVYFTDGDFTNDGTITLDIDGGASRGIYLHKWDLEQAGTALNPVFVNNNLIKGTVTSDDFEQDYAAGIFMSLGEFTNNGTIDLDVIGGRIQGLGTRGGSGTKFVNTKGNTLTLDIISNNEISHASSEYISPIDGIIASGLSTFENAGTVTVNLESHLDFVKGLVSTSGGVLKNTGTTTINGTAYGDYVYPEDVDPGENGRWLMASTWTPKTEQPDLRMKAPSTLMSIRRVDTRMQRMSMVRESFSTAPRPARSISPLTGMNITATALFWTTVPRVRTKAKSKWICVPERRPTLRSGALPHMEIPRMQIAEQLKSTDGGQKRTPLLPTEFLSAKRVPNLSTTAPTSSMPTATKQVLRVLRTTTAFALITASSRIRQAEPSQLILTHHITKVMRMRLAST